MLSGIRNRRKSGNSAEILTIRHCGSASEENLTYLALCLLTQVHFFGPQVRPCHFLVLQTGYGNFDDTQVWHNLHTTCVLGIRFCGDMMMRSSTLRTGSSILAHSRPHLCVWKKCFIPSNPLSVAPFLCLYITHLSSPLTPLLQLWLPCHLKIACRPDCCRQNDHAENGLEESQGGSGQESLAGVLGQCRALTHLNFRLNLIGAAAAESLAGVLVQCRALAHLNLSDNRIGAAGEESFAGVLGGRSTT